MRYFFIATHGKMAEGLAHTLKFLVGENPNIRFLNAYIDSTELDNELIKLITDISDNDELIIFTDMATGSVTQNLFRYTEKRNIFMITGVNLPLVLSVYLCSEKKLTNTLLENLIFEARKEMRIIEFDNYSLEEFNDE